MIDLFNSIWQKSCDIPSFTHLEGDTKTDVLIIGGGLAGLLTAHKLQQSGIKYLLIEAKNICSGVSLNTTAKITSQHGAIYHKILKKYGKETAHGYYEANQSALNAYRELCRDISCDFETKNSYIYSVDNSPTLEEEIKALETIGINHEITHKTELPFPVSGAIYFKKQAQFHPLKFVSQIAKNLNIRENTAVLSFEQNKVTTNHGVISAEHIIMTTHFPIINKHGAYFLKMFQQRSYVLALENADNVNGMYLDIVENGLSFRNHGEYLLLGGGSHRTGKKGGNWKILEKSATEFYPHSKEKFRWATQDCMTLDSIPYIGQYSRNTHNLYVATGFNKWGMTSSMVAAEILCDIILNRKNDYSEIFSPSRSIFHPQLIVNSFEAVTNLIIPSKPRCPHMGCALKWNKHEHSWDCPCHGSRFTKEGKLLQNPANGDLKQNN